MPDFNFLWQNVVWKLIESLVAGGWVMSAILKFRKSRWAAPVAYAAIGLFLASTLSVLNEIRKAIPPAEDRILKDQELEPHVQGWLTSLHAGYVLAPVRDITLFNAVATFIDKRQFLITEPAAEKGFLVLSRQLALDQSGHKALAKRSRESVNSLMGKIGITLATMHIQCTITNDLQVTILRSMPVTGTTEHEFDEAVLDLMTVEPITVTLIRESLLGKKTQ